MADHADDETRLSPALEQVRQLLFPDLSPAEGRAAIEALLRRAEDERRKRLERSDLFGDLLGILYELRDAHVRRGS